jgi:sugar lactone lactonase YvrE
VTVAAPRARNTRLNVALAAVGALSMATLWAMYWPSAIDPIAWTPTPGRSFTPTAPLGDLLRVPLPNGHGPEDIAIDDQGRVYTGLDDGRILRWDRPDAPPVEIADTDGRPLGLHFDADGRLLVADATHGLLAIEADGTITTLTSGCGGTALIFTDDLETSQDGTIWFSDASVRWRQPQWKVDVVESRASGRLCAFVPATGETREVLSGLYFANGVAVDPAGRFVLVNETSRYRVTRLWTTGSRAGQTEVFIDDLPGFPDGISTGSDGIFWIAIAGPRSAPIDLTAPWPALRRLMSRLPEWAQPAPARTARVIGVNAAGEVVHDLFDPLGEDFHVVTSVQEHQGSLYLGSLVDTAWARVPRP